MKFFPPQTEKKSVIKGRAQVEGYWWDNIVTGNFYEVYLMPSHLLSGQPSRPLYYCSII